MKAPALLLGPHLQAFFTEHLSTHKRVSPQTLASVRDSFRLLLEFLRLVRESNQRHCRSRTFMLPPFSGFWTTWNRLAGIQHALAMSGSQPYAPSSAISRYGIRTAWANSRKSWRYP